MILPNAFNSTCLIDVYSLVHFSFCYHVDNKTSFLLKKTKKNTRDNKLTYTLMPQPVFGGHQLGRMG